MISNDDIDDEDEDDVGGQRLVKPAVAEKRILATTLFLPTRLQLSSWAGEFVVGGDSD